MINPEFDLTTVDLLKRLEKGKKIGEIATVNFGMQLRNRKIFPDDVITSSDKFNLTNRSTNIRCPVLLTGSHSVIPWTIPSIMALKISNNFNYLLI